MNGDWIRIDVVVPGSWRDVVVIKLIVSGRKMLPAGFQRRSPRVQQVVAVYWIGFEMTITAEEYIDNISYVNWQNSNHPDNVEL